MNYNPTFRDMLQIALNNYRVFGAWHTAKSALAYWLEEGSVPDDFDRRYGVDTAGSVEADAIGITDEVQQQHAIRYVPIREPVLQHLLEHSLRDRAAESLSFVDLGCGKGRALLIAARFPFRRVVGVEIGASHVQIARENVRRVIERGPLLRCRDIQVAQASATDFDYPDSDLLVYMYRPFTGPVFRAALDRLAAFHAQTGREVCIALCCPNEEYLLERHPGFRKCGEFQVISSEFSWVTYQARRTES